MNLVRIPVVKGEHKIEKIIEENIPSRTTVVEDANIRLKKVSNKNLKYIDLDHSQRLFNLFNGSFINKMPGHIAYLEPSLFAWCQAKQRISDIEYNKEPISLAMTDVPCTKKLYKLDSILVVDVETMFVHEVATNTTCKKAMPNETCFCYKCNHFNPGGRKWKIKQMFDKSVSFVDENDVCFMCMCCGKKSISDISQETIVICIDIWKRPIKR